MIKQQTTGEATTVKREIGIHTAPTEASKREHCINNTLPKTYRKRYKSILISVNPNECNLIADEFIRQK